MRKLSPPCSSPNSGIALSSTVRSSGGISCGPALPSLRESPRCLLAARSAGDLQAHVAGPSRSGAVTGAHAGVAAVDGWP
jgi:hypothetical protein